MPALFLSVIGLPAHADETIANLYSTAEAIREKLDLSSHAWTVDMHAHEGNIVETGISELMGATTKLSTVAVVAELAISAESTQEQLQVQQALVQTDMTITEADVDDYNTALKDVETYAQQAGAFLSAAQDTSITSAVDNYSAQNNIAVASYSTIAYTQDIDKFVISYDNDLYMSFQGFFQNKMVSADDIYNQTSYTQ